MNVILSLADVTIRGSDQTLYPNTNLNINKGEHLAIVGNDEQLKTALMDAIAGKVPVVRGHRIFNPPHISNTDIKPLHNKLIVSVSARHHFKNLSHTSTFYYQQRFNSIDAEDSQTVQQYLDGIGVAYAQHNFSLNFIVEQFKLKGLLDKGLIKLSNGETKRVLIAAAVLHNPVMLVLYSPLSGLDVNARVEINELIDQVAESGISIVLTGQLNELPACVTHLAIVNQREPLKQVIAAINKNESLQINLPQSNIAEVQNLLYSKPVEHFNTIVELKDVSIRYADKTILKDINWKILQGERWALTGPNGAGKSTMLSLITGDNPQAFANNIILFDRQKGSGESIWDIKKNIGFFSPELYQYFPGDQSALQAVESGFYDTVGLFKPTNKTKAAIALQWMKLLSVDKFANKPLRNLSPSDQRLCLLARALVKKAPLLILDEPFQGFDDIRKHYCKHLVNSICTLSNTTLIFVSHYADDIPDCVTKTFALNQGMQS